MKTEQIKQIVRDAYKNDELVELLTAMHEEASALSEAHWKDKLKTFPKVAARLKRHGEDAQYKLGSWLMMTATVFDYARVKVADWKLYRDETAEEHQLRNAREELELAEQAASSRRRAVEEAQKKVKSRT